MSIIRMPTIFSQAMNTLDNLSQQGILLQGNRHNHLARRAKLFSFILRPPPSTVEDTFFLVDKVVAIVLSWAAKQVPLGLRCWLLLDGNLN